MEFILASSSPRRKQLLSTIISNFDIIPSDIDENKLKKLEPNPQKLAEKLSYEKAYSIFIDKYKENNEYTVIGSDTLVSFGNIILGKPKDRDDAIRILKLLQGNSHDIYTGTTVIIKKEHSIIFETRVNKSTVYFKNMSYYDICSYVDTKEPMDKSGAYAVQGIGKVYLKGYDGDYNSIVGLDTHMIKSIFEKYNLI
ncbi:MAG: septum formation protein Maf [Clostridium sp.]|jgi:septum formation protein maf|uniref:Maf family protein n=1 Tax=Candidatus Merdicola sp. TaxID=3085652 RepID=UPI001D95BA6B|nr:septum formation protein Maf [Clostridium sp.]